MKNLSKSTFSLKIKRVFYGWYVAVASAIIVFWTVGLGIKSNVFIFTSFAKKLVVRESLLALFFVIFFMTIIITNMVLNFFIKKINLKILLITSVSIFSLAFISLIFIDNIFLLYVVALFLGASCSGACFIAIPAILENWFFKYRHIAVAMVIVAALFSSMFFLPILNSLSVTNLFFLQHGWQSAVIIFGVLYFLINILLSIFVIKDNPKKIGLYPDNSFMVSEQDIKNFTGEGFVLKKVIKSQKFWHLNGSIFFLVFASFGIMQYLPIYLQIEKNFDITTASLIYGFTSGIAIIGFFLYEDLLLVKSLKSITIIFLVLMIVGIGFLFFMNNLIFSILFMVLFGVFSAMTISLPIIATRKMFGTIDLHKILWVVATFVFISCATSSYVTIVLKNLYNTFILPYIIYLVVLIFLIPSFIILFDKKNLKYK